MERHTRLVYFLNFCDRRFCLVQGLLFGYHFGPGWSLHQTVSETTCTLTIPLQSEVVRTQALGPGGPDESTSTW